MTEAKLGQLVTDPRQTRDAIHVAVIPATNVTRRDLRPGEHLANGIVDPFLTAPVRPGERFWLCLFPGTVTAIAHHWTHAAFPNEPATTELALRRSEADVWASLEEAK